MLRMIKGDLIKRALRGEFDVIGHGANCQRIMSTGIALPIARTFPCAVYADVHSALVETEKPGDVSVGFNPVPKLFVANLYTQRKPGPCFELELLRSALRKLEYDWLTPEDRIGFPMIGAGIGGGTWEDIRKVIEEELRDYDVTIVEYAPE